MTVQDFIFSGKTSTRLLRHASFWGIFCIKSFYDSLYIDTSFAEFKNWSLYYNAFLSFFLFLPTLIALVYTCIYVLIPKFIFKKKYFVFILAVILLLVLNLLCDFFIAKKSASLFSLSPTNMHVMFINTWFRAFAKGFQNSITLVSVAVSLKLTKYWYLRQQENNRLTALKLYTEKQILKANIRPDFLLYSLDNLRKKISVSYKDSAEMILHLSEVFSHILYDCSEELISLKKEIAAVENLIAVEKISHNNEVEMDITTNIPDENKLIPTLLIFSFLQKIFGENEIENKKFNNISIYIYTLRDELCLKCKLNYFDKISIDFIPIEKLNENEKKLYALFNRFEITRNESENNYEINLATFLYEPDRVKV